MSWTHLKDSRPKARKRHRCFLCAEPIEPGETYVRRSGVGEDEPESFVMHVECEAAAQSWEWWEWEEFFSGDMPRPGSQRAMEAEKRQALVAAMEMSDVYEIESED